MINTACSAGLRKTLSETESDAELQLGQRFATVDAALVRHTVLTTVVYCLLLDWVSLVHAYHASGTHTGLHAYALVPNMTL